MGDGIGAEMSEFEDRDSEHRFAEKHPEASMRRREFLAKAGALAGAAGLAGALPADLLPSPVGAARAARSGLPSPRNMPVDTFVVLMMENRSFDHYFGSFPGADGRNAGLAYPDSLGVMHPTHALAPDFQGCGFGDPNHEWEGARVEYNNGKLDGFYKASDEYALGYYLERDLPFIAAAAREFTLYDRYFASLLGPTWPNREYMHSAQSGGNKANASPQDAVAAYVAGQGLYEWETIWDRLLQQGISCAYYHSDQPFIGVFGKRFVGITRPVAEFYADAAAGQLPHVAFVDPPFLDGAGGDGLSGDEHPHGDIRIGQAFMSDVAHAFINSPQFRRGAMFINYDEWGGFFDHVSPIFVPDDRSSSNLDDNFGITGFRIPGVAISPYAPRHTVSHMSVTHESILKLISYRFGLGDLNTRHRYASNIGLSFAWDKPDFTAPSLPSPTVPLTAPCGLPSAGSASTSETRSGEGLSIGDPVMLDYFRKLGYDVRPATPDRVFSSSDAAKRALGHLWKEVTG
jgi:phospholipase C